MRQGRPRRLPMRLPVSLILLFLVLLFSSSLMAQQGTVIVRDGTTNTQASVKQAGTVTPNVIGIQGNASGVPIPVTGTVTVSTVTSLCTQTSLQKFTTVGVGTGAGTSVTSTTSCIAGTIYVNNITNSAATIRLQDKTGTPIIWIGGNADFSVPANSNLAIHLEGLVFTSGITAIAGTGSALNLFIPTLQ